MGMMQDCFPDHDWYQLFSEPADLGFNGISRFRTWCIGSHQDRSVCLFDPFETLDSIKQGVQQRVQTSVNHYLVSSFGEISLECQQEAQRRGILLERNPSLSDDEAMDWSHVLSENEQRTVRSLNVKYVDRFGQDPLSDKSLVYFLGDTADYCSWSAVSGRIPTFRVNSKSGKFWLPGHGRWMTCRERLVAMGFPCTLQQSRELGVPVVGAADIRRAADLLGNSMHFQSAGVLQLIALGCFGPLDPTAWLFHLRPPNVVIMSALVLWKNAVLTHIYEKISYC